jgi:hypothetical protein
MENKYYTPEIEDFNVGFEYEYFDKTDDNEKLLFQVNSGIPLEIIENWIQNNKVRVKYLDREDIESLGYNYSFRFNEGYLQDNYKHKSNYSLLTYSPNSNFLSITNCESGEFLGVVKNKSELKKLLQQLNIKQVWRF